MNFEQWVLRYAASRGWTIDGRERCVAEAAWHAGRDALRQELRAEIRAERNDPTSEPLDVATATLNPTTRLLEDLLKRHVSDGEALGKIRFQVNLCNNLSYRQGAADAPQAGAHPALGMPYVHDGPTQEGAVQSFLKFAAGYDKPTTNAQAENLVETWRRENPEIANAVSNTTPVADAPQAGQLPKGWQLRRGASGAVTLTGPGKERTTLAVPGRNQHILKHVYAFFSALCDAEPADAPQAEELTDAQAQAAGYNWCPTCFTWVPRSEVTVDEHHEACGAYVACFPGARWVGVDMAENNDD